MWGFVAFVGATVAMARYVDTSVSFRDPAFASKMAKLGAATTTGPGPTVVIFGSSRVLSGFDAVRAEAVLNRDRAGAVAFNFGASGAGAITQQLFHNRLASRGTRFSLVVVELFPVFLHDDGAGPIERQWLNPRRLSGDERRTYVRYGGRDAGFASPWASARAGLFRRTFPWLAPNPEGGPDDPSDARGYVPNETVFRGTLDRQKVIDYHRDLYREPLNDLRLVGGSVAAVRDMDDDLARSRAIVRYVLLPESRPFRRLYAARSEATLRTFLHSLKSPIIDARSWVADDGFSDEHHLNVEGARAFTDRFTAEVLLPWLREGLP